jgi:hypothetical protein
MFLFFFLYPRSGVLTYLTTNQHKHHQQAVAVVAKKGRYIHRQNDQLYQELNLSQAPPKRAHATFTPNSQPTLWQKRKSKSQHCGWHTLAYAFRICT